MQKEIKINIIEPEEENEDHNLPSKNSIQTAS